MLNKWLNLGIAVGVLGFLLCLVYSLGRSSQHAPQTAQETPVPHIEITVFVTVSESPVQLSLDRDIRLWSDEGCRSNQVEQEKTQTSVPVSLADSGVLTAAFKEAMLVFLKESVGISTDGKVSAQSGGSMYYSRPPQPPAVREGPSK